MGRGSWGPGGGQSIDRSELNELALDLSKAPGRIQRRVPKVLRRGALEVKRGMARDFFSQPKVAGHRGYYPHVARAVSYDELTPFDFEIGVDKNAEQGPLANILAFGSVNNAPVVDQTASLRREMPKIQMHLGDAAEDCVLSDKGES